MTILIFLQNNGIAGNKETDMFRDSEIQISDFLIHAGTQFRTMAQGHHSHVLNRFPHIC